VRRETQHARVLESRVKNVLSYPRGTAELAHGLKQSPMLPVPLLRQENASNRVSPDLGGNHVGAGVGLVSPAEETPAEAPDPDLSRAMVLFDGAETSAKSCPLRMDK